MSQKVLSISFQPPLDNGEGRYFVGGVASGGSGHNVLSIEPGSHGPIPGYFVTTRQGAEEFIPASQVSRARLVPRPPEESKQGGKHGKQKAYA